jgi:uncharacterized membrane protein YeaQ/YmgE (transglycosylase-associated protein family)
MRTIASALAGGFLGTLVLTTVLRAANELGLTRMDLPFLLGTTITDNRRKAKAIGYFFHFLMGLGFALVYGALFTVLGWSSWWLGALLGALHALFVGTVLVNVLLPVVHPRIATPETAANDVALIEPPGFLMLNYGRNTFLVTLVAHIVYGAIIGWVART